MNTEKFGKLFLYTVILFFATMTVVYYFWFFDAFMEISKLQGISLLLMLIFTTTFFVYYTIDFSKNSNSWQEKCD